MQTVTQNRYFIDPKTLPMGVAADQIERVLAGEAAQMGNLGALQKSLEKLMISYRASRLEILGKEGNRQLREFMQQHRKAAPVLAQPQLDAAKSQLQQEPLQSRLVYPEPPVQAEKLQSLKALNVETKQTFNTIIEAAAPAGTSSSEHVSTLLGATYYPPYGWWDRNTFDAYDYATGSGQIKQHQSFLWADVGRTGSCLWGQNLNADDIDLIQMVRGNGFLVGYTTPKQGLLRVLVELECGFCQHCIQTWDEYGWSDVSAVTREILSVGVLYNWADPDLGVEVRDYGLVYGLRASGDGERSPGVVYPYQGGTKRYFLKYINVNLPAGTGLYVYVGTEQQAWSWLNDVSCNIFTNSGWYVKSVNVQTV